MFKFGAFYHNMLKIHPTDVNWAPPSVKKERKKKKTMFIGPTIHEKAPQKAGTYTYHVNVRPPGPLTLEGNLTTQFPHAILLKVSFVM